MRRLLALPAAALLTIGLVAATHRGAGTTAEAAPPPAQKPAAKDADASAASTAEAQFYTAQAALFSALAHAVALEKITERTGPDFSLARTLISTANRSIQGVDSSSVSMGQALHELEKEEAMKTLRSELNEAIQATDEAHSAADGHGTVNPHAKNMVAHLTNATTALVQLAQAMDIEPMAAPGHDAIENALGGGNAPGAAPKASRRR